MKTISSKNNNDNNGGDEQPQLRRSAQKRKLNELTTGGKTGGEDQIQQEEGSSSKMNRDEKNDQDLEQKIVQLPQPDVTEANKIADENEKQAELPIQPMKIQLSKETWFDMLEFVGRRQLGQLVPQIGDRRFAGIAQAFLHNYGRITLANICGISDPQHPLIQHVVALPENVKNFWFIFLSYLNTPVINFLQKFKQASLFGNVNLDLRLQKTSIDGANTLLQALSHIVPSFDNINSIRGTNITQLVYLYNAGSELTMAMLKMARFLEIFYDHYEFAANETEFLMHWLHTPRDDGKPRVLILPLDFYALRFIIHLTIKAIKSEFAAAKVPVCFFIRLFVPNKVDWHDSGMENEETNEKLVFKKVTTTAGPKPTNLERMALISRYPLGAGKHWIEANEREALDWDFNEQNSRICLATSIWYNYNYGDRGRAAGLL